MSGTPLTPRSSKQPQMHFCHYTFNNRSEGEDYVILIHASCLHTHYAPLIKCVDSFPINSAQGNLNVAEDRKGSLAMLAICLNLEQCLSLKTIEQKPIALLAG